MTVDSIAAKDAKKILRRMCKVLSRIYNVKLTLHCNRVGEAIILSEFGDIAAVSIPKFAPVRTLYFEDAKQMLKAVLTKDAEVYFPSTKRHTITAGVEINNYLGTTLEEAMIKLDLLKA